MYHPGMHRLSNHPLPRGASKGHLPGTHGGTDSSPPTSGKRALPVLPYWRERIIPSNEGQTRHDRTAAKTVSNHPLQRGANFLYRFFSAVQFESSPPTSGKPSVFMRLSAALNTTLCNLHKFYSQPVTYHFIYI